MQLWGRPASGKSAIVKAVGKYGVVEMISHTTRQPERGEQHGVDYYFVTEEELSKIQLVERIHYAGNYYALSKEEVMKKVRQYPGHRGCRGYSWLGAVEKNYGGTGDFHIHHG